jgi:hypothetical protein
MNKTEDFLFYDDFNFFRFHINFYASFDNKTELFNYFNLKFAFINI